MAPKFKSRYDEQVEASASLHQRFYANLLIPKYDYNPNPNQQKAPGGFDNREQPVFCF